MSFRLHSIVPHRWTSPFLSHFHSSFKRSYANQTTKMGALVKSSPDMIVVNDPDLLEKKKASIRLDGPSKLQVIADFDATLTRFLIDGCRGQSSHSLLQQGNPEYDFKREKLYDYYHPIEFNPTLPIDEKTKLMEEWWGKTHSLLIEGGLTYESIKNSVAGATIAFREGVTELFEFLEEREIPVLIFSAGLADIIEEVLRQKLHRTFKNVKIVSNRMVFDQNGNLTSFKGKTIHSLNKNEHSLDMAASLHDQLGEVDEVVDSASVKRRTNVLLLGDHIGDLGMSDGLNYETRISVGFLNHNIENSLESYRKGFDIVYLNDAPMLGVMFHPRNNVSFSTPSSEIKSFDWSIYMLGGRELGEGSGAVSYHKALYSPFRFLNFKGLSSSSSSSSSGCRFEQTEETYGQRSI